MIHKLRIRLILASMLSLLIVLTVIFGIVGILNYRNIVTDADSILFILQENDGSFVMDKPPKGDRVPADSPPKTVRPFSPELPYESRYFSVFLTKDGAVSSVNTGKIAAVDTETAIEYAQTVVQDRKKSQGFLGDYRYTIYDTENETHIIFLDYGREMRSFRRFLFTSAGVCAVGFLSVLLLMFFLSARIVKPFSENYEKQKRFITDAGHELKTPLTIIDADAEVLEMDIGQNEWLNDIQTQTKHLAQLTNSLILLSRMEEQPQTEKIEFPISDLVEETAETFQTLAKKHNKTISSCIQSLLSIKGDEKEIRQLVTILLDNAVKYADDKGKIEISLKRQKNTVYLSVFNTVDSISQENLQHLFDRFYRTDKSRNSETGGYGLGLSIASAIVNAHKGKITASTQDGKSLCVTVAFPVS